MRDDVLYEKFRMVIINHAKETGRSLKDMEDAVRLFYTAFEDGLHLNGEETIKDVSDKEFEKQMNKFFLKDLIWSVLMVATGFIMGLLF